MHLVDHRVRPRRLRAAVVRPLVVGRVIVDDDTLRDVRRRVPVVAHGVGDLLLRPVADVPVHLGRQTEVAVDGTRVRIEEELRRVPAGARPRVPAAVHTEAVPLSRPHARHETVPDLMGQFGQRQPHLHALVVEEAQLDRLRAARPQREVGARHAVGADAEARPQRGRGTGPYGHDGRRTRSAVQHGGRGMPLWSGSGQPGARGELLLTGQPVARRALLLLLDLLDLLLGCARHLFNLQRLG